MEIILIYGSILYGYTCVLTTAVHLGRGGCTKETLLDSLCTCVLIPFYPVILPFFLPFYYYCEYRAERNIREGRRNDNRNGYDGFQEQTQNNNTVENN